MWQGNWPWTTSWVILTIVVMFGSVFFLARAFKPSIRNYQDGFIDVDHTCTKAPSFCVAIYFFIVDHALVYGCKTEYMVEDFSRRMRRVFFYY